MLILRTHIFEVTENYHAFYKMPLHDKVVVWYATNARCPILFYKTLNLDQYIQDTLKPFFLNSRLMKEDSVAVSNNMVQQRILTLLNERVNKTCSITESSVQDCGLQDHLVLVIFICEAALKGKCIGTTLTLLKPSRVGSGMLLPQLQWMNFSVFCRDSFDSVSHVSGPKVITYNPLCYIC
jgi:hypothetical protein